MLHTDAGGATAEGLRARADATSAFTIGVEEEHLLVVPDGTSAAEVSSIVASRAAGDPRFRSELPPCQIEMASPTRTSTADVEVDLRAARRSIGRWCTDVAVPISAAVHPTDADFAAAVGSRGRDLVARYGWLARSQVLGALHVHVALGSADRLLAVHDELRLHLPHLAAIAAAAPFFRGEDQGMASHRPIVASMLPRQGIPPALVSWEAYAEELRWGAASGAAPDPTQWWWEVRPHPTHGTLEIRVADAQPTVDDAMAVVEVTVALVRWLTARADADDLPLPAATWRIDENRRSAAVHGLDGTFCDVRDGRRRPAAEVVLELLDAIEPWAERGLARTRTLVADPSHRRIRTWGLHDAVDQLAVAFTA